MFSSQMFSAEFSTDDQGEFYTIFSVGKESIEDILQLYPVEEKEDKGTQTKKEIKIPL